jgi:L-fuculose-phosphate aldolase
MTHHRELIHPRDEIMRTMERIYRYRMTTTSGGNISILDDDGAIWITPARLDKGNLRRDDIVRVAADGSHDGPHRPSSELPFHRAIYDGRPDIRGIVHAHPVALVAFSICRRVPDTNVLRQARKICGTVGFAPYALPGSAALGRNIAETFATGTDCVILENHGVVIGGSGLQQAFERFETLEFAAKTIIKASILGTPRPLPTETAELGPVPEPLPHFDPIHATSVEKDLRRKLCEFVRRAYQQRLMISTQGALSARLGEDTFLITPHRVDRSRLTIGDIVLVHQGAPERGKTPSGSARNHRSIYREHPRIQSIVNAYPVNATAFGLTDTPLDSRTIPESYLFLKDVNRVPFGTQFGDGTALARLGSPKDPVLIIDNDGVQVWGTSILDAFDRLEVLETTAEAMIGSKALGPMVPMSAEAIADLKTAFGVE